MYDQDNSGAISPEEMVEIFTLMYSVQVGGVPAGRKHRYYNTLFNNVPHPTFFKCSKINFLTRCFTLNAICRAAQRRMQWSKPERLSQYLRIFVGFDKHASIFADIFVGFDKYLARFLRPSMWTRTAKLDWRSS